MGVYGLTLEAFPEQWKDYTYFAMDAAQNDNYGTRYNSKIIRGILRTYSAPPSAEGRKVIMREGNLVKQSSPFFLYNGILTVGYFIDDTVFVYRIISQNIFDAEMGLTIHVLEKLVGSNGKDVTTLAYNVGTDNFV